MQKEKVRWKKIHTTSERVKLQTLLVGWFQTRKEGGPTKPTAYLNNIMKADDVGMVSPAQDGNLGPQTLLQFFIQPLRDDLLDGQVKIGLLLMIGLPHHGEGTRPDLLRRHIIPDPPWSRHDHPTPYSLPLFLVLFLFFLFSVSRLLFPSCHLPFSDSITYRVFFVPAFVFPFQSQNLVCLLLLLLPCTVRMTLCLCIIMEVQLCVCLRALDAMTDKDKGLFPSLLSLAFSRPMRHTKANPPTPRPHHTPPRFVPFSGCLSFVAAASFVWQAAAILRRRRNSGGVATYHRIYRPSVNPTHPILQNHDMSFVRHVCNKLPNQHKVNFGNRFIRESGPSI